MPFTKIKVALCFEAVPRKTERRYRTFISLGREFITLFHVAFHTQNVLNMKHAVVHVFEPVCYSTGEMEWKPVKQAQDGGVAPYSPKTH